MEQEKTIIEIGGVRLEVDLRTARRVEEYRVGDNVKILIKSYGEVYTSYPGVIVGFDAFKNLPTIIIAYLKAGYDAEICFAYINSKSEDVELAPMDGPEIAINRTMAIEQLDRKIDAAEKTVAELKIKKNYFLENFGRYFPRGEGKAEAVSTGLDA